MGKAEYMTINITNMLLYLENPRFDSVDQQSTALEEITRDQQEKLIELSKHIHKYGLNPSELILVKPHGKQWVVREGNRRATVLKFMNEPSLVPTEFPKIRKYFEDNHSSFSKDVLKSVPCVVLNDEDEIDEWIRLKHTGENDGAGTVRWDAQQAGRFRVKGEGKGDMLVSFLEDMRQHKFLPSDVKVNLKSIKKTNFDRLMADPYVQKSLGISRTGGKLHCPTPSPYLIAVLRELISNKVSVGNIYHKKDRETYINNIISDVDRSDSEPNNEADAPPADKESTPASPSNPKQPAKTSKGSSYPINRKTLVPSSHALTISHARIAKIFNELKKMDLNEYPNAIAVLFRVFIELSADHYIENSKLKGVSIDSTLPIKITAIADDLKAKGIMTDHNLRSIRQMTSSQTQNKSIKTFHSYVHNKDVTPAATDLKSAWDDIWPFIENLWR